MDWYLVLRLVHILSATVLLGTGLGIAFFMLMAVRGGDVGHIARTGRQVVLADAIFTAVAVVVQPISGIWLAQIVGYPMMSTWLIATYFLYVIAAAAWLPVVWIQIRLSNLAGKADDETQPLSTEFHRLFKIWFWLGWPGFLSVFGIFVLMVFKPGGWA